MAPKKKKSKKEGKKSSLTCKLCQQVFTNEDDRLVECEKCENWECQACAELTNVEYDALQIAGSRIHWYCGICNEDAITAVKTAELIKTKCKQYIAELRDELIEHTDGKRKEMKAEIEQELEFIREEINSVREEVKVTRVDQKLESIRNEIHSVRKEVKETSISGSADKNLEEMELRDLKKLNIIFFNVEESKAVTKEDVKKEDMTNLTKIQDVLNTSATFSNITRLGARISGKVRPIKVTLNNTSEHQEILKAAKKLNTDTVFNQVYISRDMTPLERDSSRKLVKERKEKQEESNNKKENVRWVIYKGQVVKGRAPVPPEEKAKEE